MVYTVNTLMLVKLLEMCLLVFCWISERNGSCHGFRSEKQLERHLQRMVVWQTLIANHYNHKLLTIKLQLLTYFWLSPNTARALITLGHHHCLKRVALNGPFFPNSIRKWYYIEDQALKSQFWQLTFPATWFTVTITPLIWEHTGPSNCHHKNVLTAYIECIIRSLDSADC